MGDEVLVIFRKQTYARYAGVPFDFEVVVVLCLIREFIISCGNEKEGILLNSIFSEMAWSTR